MMIDLEKNCESLKINKETYVRILNKAVWQTQQDILDFEAALPVDDFEKIQAISHRWKGDYGNMRVDVLSNIAKRMNEVVRTNKEKEQVLQLLGEFKTCFQQLKRLIEEKSP